MKHGRYGIRKESGIALVALLVLLIMAGAYAFYRYANVAGGRIQQEAKLAATLARAKEALIARAVTDANRPGSLPCPDLITNNVGLSNFPGDGKADMFTLTQCPSYVGWLPWVTLDLPELSDDTGTRLWYALSPELRDDDSAQPINSDRALAQQLDGAADIAAVIIAPRAAIGSQARPSNTPSDYLDGENGNGDDRIYISGPQGPAFNDMVVAISRQELMAAVEKRVASEVKACLEQHAASAVNTEHTYPWPAPLSNSTFRGTAGSLFGQIPATQPSAGPENLLKQTTSAVTNAKLALASASTATDQMAALVAVSEAVTIARALYDKLYGVASALASVAGTTQIAFGTLAADINSAAANGRISRTERTNLRAEAITVKTSLTALQTALVDSGIDPFPGEVLAQNVVLQQKLATATSTPSTANFTALQNQAVVLVNLFSLSTTPNPDLTAALTNALNAAAATVVAAGNAAATPTDAALVTIANTAAQALVAADDNLRNTITASRVNLNSSEISVRAVQLSSLVAAVAASPDAASATALAAGLAEMQGVTNALVTASSPVVAARTATLTALSDALGAAQAASDFTLIQSTANTAIAAANTLATAIANNGDNIARESLAVAASQYLAAQAIFNTVAPPTQAAMVPYVRAVQDPAVDIGYWAQHHRPQRDGHRHPGQKGARRHQRQHRFGLLRRRPGTLGHLRIERVAGPAASLYRCTDQYQQTGRCNNRTERDTKPGRLPADQRRYTRQHARQQQRRGISNTLVRQRLRLPATSERQHFVVDGKQLGQHHVLSDQRPYTPGQRQTAGQRQRYLSRRGPQRRTGDRHPEPRHADNRQLPRRHQCRRLARRRRQDTRSAYFRMPRYRVHSTTD